MLAKHYIWQVLSFRNTTQASVDPLTFRLWGQGTRTGREVTIIRVIFSINIRIGDIYESMARLHAANNAPAVNAARVPALALGVCAFDAYGIDRNLRTLRQENPHVEAARPGQAKRWKNLPARCEELHAPRVVSVLWPLGRSLRDVRGVDNCVGHLQSPRTEQSCKNSLQYRANGLALLYKQSCNIIQTVFAIFYKQSHNI